MEKNNTALLKKVEHCLQVTGMGETYFGKKSVGNSELVFRLRNGGRVWPETEEKITSFIARAISTYSPPINKAG